MKSATIHALEVKPTTYMRRVVRAHEIVNEASRDLRVADQDGAEAVSFLAMAVAVHLKASVGPTSGRAAMQAAIDYAFGSGHA